MAEEVDTPGRLWSSGLAVTVNPFDCARQKKQSSFKSVCCLSRPQFFA
jgi:hypothetical protein